MKPEHNSTEKLEPLTIDLSATREALRIKFYNLNQYCTRFGIPQSSMQKLLSGATLFDADPASGYQARLRHLHDNGVLVQQAWAMKEAA